MALPNRPEPAAQFERRNPADDEFYELAGTWLRDNTRNTKTFSILFNELVAYGFPPQSARREVSALALNVLVVLICAGILWYRWPFDMSDSMIARIIVVLVVAAAHALYFLLLVNGDSLKAAARTCARQLILSCETFLAGAKPAAKTGKKQVRLRPGLAALYGAVASQDRGLGNGGFLRNRLLAGPQREERRRHRHPLPNRSELVGPPGRRRVREHGARGRESYPHPVRHGSHQQHRRHSRRPGPCRGCRSDSGGVPGRTDVDVAALAIHWDSLAVLRAVLVGTAFGNYTRYAAGIVAASKQQDAGRALIAFLSSPAARALMNAKGFEPL
jgi:Bacterial extracellular solute-binding protein